MYTRYVSMIFWIAIAALFFFPINASDFYHHLNTGRSIVETHTLPYNDTFSFTAYGQPWVAFAWGTGLIYYILYTTLGHIGISLFTAAVGILTAWVIFQSAKRYGLSPLISYTATALIATLLSLRWPTRPEIWSPCFISIVLFGLIHKTKLSPWYIFLFFIWGILYGSSAFLGIGILLLFVLLISKQKLKDLMIVLGCTFASCANGYGLSSFLYILQIPAIAAHTGEWLPLFETINPIRAELALFYQWQVISYLIFTVIVILSFLRAITTKRTSTFWFITLLALVCILPFKSVRFINLAPIICSGILFYALSQIHSTKKNIWINVGVGLFAILIALVRFATFSFMPGEEFTKLPMQFLRTHNIKGNIMSIQEMGAHISWELPDSKVLYDTRDDLYQPTGIFGQIQLIDEGKQSVETLIQRYKIPIIIGDFGTGSIYKSLLYSPDWALVYITDGFFILVQKDIAVQKKLQQFDAIDPLRIPPAKPGEVERAYEQMKAIHMSDQSSLENNVRLAELAFSLDRPQEALSLTDTLQFPSIFAARWASETVANAELRGKYALAADNCTLAKTMLQKAEYASYHRLIFSPKTRLPNNTDRYLGQYFQTCENDSITAKEYFMKFLQSTNNPLEKRVVEQQLQRL